MIDKIKSLLKRTPVINWWYKIRDIREAWKWKRHGKPIPPPSYIKQQIVKKYAKEYGAKTLVETGTYLGEMVNATRNIFTQIYSIELNKDLFEAASKKFLRFNHIHILNGDSSQVLGEVINKIETPILFWLNAHYSGGSTSKADKQTPIATELDVIFSARLHDYVILIDDAHLFNGEDDYPELEYLTKLVLGQERKLTLSIENDVIRIYPNILFK